jgi:hypothetical protein
MIQSGFWRSQIYAHDYLIFLRENRNLVEPDAAIHAQAVIVSVKRGIVSL